MLRSKYPNHSIVVSDDWQINILNLEGVTWKPLDGVELQSHVAFVAPARRNQSGRLTRSIRFGGFDVKWREESFILYIASVSICSLTLT
jgi:transitional endoplasmic reticulum ATPase